MSNDLVKALLIIAGRGVYPRLLAECARAQGVARIEAIAFKGETDRRLTAVVDRVHWLNLGRLGALLDSCRASGIHTAVLAGQITPTHLFHLRLDAPMRNLLRALPERNAHTIFGAICEELRTVGLELMEAHSFMTSAMPDPGPLAGPLPSDQEQADIALGLRVAKATSGLDIGQTVVVKAGTILAVEAFEGTDETIVRAGRLGGAGSVVVKVAKQGHDMRFDIPVVGTRTLRKMTKARARVLALEAQRTILLERDQVIEEANRRGISVLAVSMNREDKQ